MSWFRRARTAEPEPPEGSTLAPESVESEEPAPEGGEVEEHPAPPAAAEAPPAQQVSDPSAVFDAGDTGSWLVEDLVPKPADAASQAAAAAEAEDETWGVAATGEAESRPAEAESTEAEAEPSRDEAAQGDAVQVEAAQVEEPRSEPATAELAEIRRQLATITVELDRVSGRVREEVSAQLESREPASTGTEGFERLQTTLTGRLDRLLKATKASAQRERSRTAEELAAAVSELRAEIAASEKRVGSRLEREVRAGSGGAEPAEEVSGARIREEIAAQLDSRRDVAMEDSAAFTRLKTELSEQSETLLGTVRSNAEAERARASEELREVAAELRGELAAAEKRLRSHVVSEIRAHTKALDRENASIPKLGEALNSRIDGLERRIDRIAAENDELNTTLSVLARHRATLAAAPPAQSSEQKGVDLNEATFEDLRKVGLSSTQAARVLTYRDANGGFDSVERLGQVPGLPRKLVERIKPLLRV